MRRAILAATLAMGGLGALAACAPKVHPTASPFEVDDPRAGSGATAPAATDGDAGVATADAPRLPGARGGDVSRAQVKAVLDAGPAEILRGLEVAARRSENGFTGWRLVRFVGDAPPFTGVDVAPGDVLLRVNGHTLESPQDLSALWLELYTAVAIDALIERDGLTFAIHYDVRD